MVSGMRKVDGLGTKHDEENGWWRENEERDDEGENGSWKENDEVNEPFLWHVFQLV